MPRLPHITVCICTCGRLEMLERLLRKMDAQESGGEFTISVAVTDNDPETSARAVVDRCRREASLSISYSVEKEKNIALARNNVLAQATGEFVAFIDDDELPVPGWLLNLFRTCETHQVAGVLGPVKPYFRQKAPAWLVKGGFYDRPTHPTGFRMSWPECRTGNVLLRRTILEPSEPVFRREFGAGGEDQDFFRRMIERGHRFVWCDEAVAYEEVPASRWSRRFMLHRALLRGRNSIRHRKGRVRNLLKSLIAVPAYGLALPVLLVAGHHYFMRYLVKLADHVGRLLALVGMNPVRERRM